MPRCPNGHGCSPIESVCKDVECTFGILKGSFRILKIPSLFSWEDMVNNVFITCCMLHNMILIQDNAMCDWEINASWAMEGQHDDNNVGLPLGDSSNTIVQSHTDASAVCINRVGLSACHRHLPGRGRLAPPQSTAACAADVALTVQVLRIQTPELVARARSPRGTAPRPLTRRRQQNGSG